MRKKRAVNSTPVLSFAALVIVTVGEPADPESAKCTACSLVIVVSSIYFIFLNNEIVVGDLTIKTLDWLVVFLL